MLVCSKVMWKYHKTLQLELAAEAWRIILKGVKSPLRMFSKLNIFAAIL